ncbi:MAG: SURF1 family protein [Hyphomicrobiaceae bacterium]
MVDRRTGLLWPTIASALAFVVLIGLGTWQVQRLKWKNHLIEQIEARVKAPPIPFEEALKRAQAGADLEYTHVRLRGQWHEGGPELYLWMPTQAGPGFHVYAPLDTAPLDAGNRVVIVNRGFVPEARRDPATRPEPKPDPTKAIEIVGLIRMPEAKGMFTPENNPAKNIWYWRDLQGMAVAMKLDPEVLAPFFVEAEKGSAAGPFAPEGGVTRLEIPNNHLQYALTWYGIAATLVGVYVAFVRSRLQRGSEDAKSAT